MPTYLLERWLAPTGILALSLFLFRHPSCTVAEFRKTIKSISLASECLKRGMNDQEYAGQFLVPGALHKATCYKCRISYSWTRQGASVFLEARAEAVNLMHYEEMSKYDPI
ncbi:hypothetical protein QBC38DRAFT_61245 [Podospora fimiseda]|uniref:Uncharacterized protein n=1 Tax=Podospora fimiseda TaxID=252190 RepID=A0AAN7BGE0_9PEZI|nr:hypothetical protein QBC38DRAFT_61245 [Podospora fimiseda]